MAELDFPASPSNGQTYTPSGSTITYTYTTAKGSWEGSLSGSQYALQDKITLTATNTANATHYPTFVNTATGDEEIRTDTGLLYNPSTGLLTTTGITADLTGTFGVDLGSDAEGDTYYRNSSGNFVRLARGTDNHIMTMNGNVPNWEAVSGSTGYSNSNTSTAPGGSGNYDLAELAAQNGDETPFDTVFDAFSVIKVSVYDCEDPLGSISTVDYGSGESYVGA